MTEENQGGQNQNNFFKYDTNTLAEVYTSPAEASAAFGIGLAGLVNALIRGGEHKILTPRVKPLNIWEPENKDPTKGFNLYYATGGWLGSETEYEWKPVTLREKKEKPVTPQPYPYRPYSYPHPYRPHSQTPTNQSQSGRGIIVPNLPNTDDFENMWKNIKSYIGG